MPNTASKIVGEQIRHWQNRGVTVNDAWEALGHKRRLNATWAMVREFMISWLLDEAEAGGSRKRAA